MIMSLQITSNTARLQKAAIKKRQRETNPSAAVMLAVYFRLKSDYRLLMISVSLMGSTIAPSLYTRILPEAISSMRITSPLL